MCFFSSQTRGALPVVVYCFEDLDVPAKSLPVRPNVSQVRKKYGLKYMENQVKIFLLLKDYIKQGSNNGKSRVSPLVAAEK